MTEEEQKALTLAAEADSQRQAGDYKQSLALALQAFMAAPHLYAPQASLFAILSCTSGFRLPDALTRMIATIVEGGSHDVQALATLVNSQFGGSETVQALNDRLAAGDDAATVTALASGAFDVLLKDPLFLTVASRATLISPELETLLTGLRACFLRVALAGALRNLDPAWNDLLCALAAQAFNGEYIWAVAPDEVAQLDHLIAALRDRGEAPDMAEYALVGAYRPLAGFDLVPDARDPARMRPLAKFLVRQQVGDPAEEAVIAANMPAVTPIASAFSGKMQAQYESFPYPRWQTTARVKQGTLNRHLEASFPGGDWRRLPDGAVDMLVAGSGTGEHVVSLMGQFETATVAAVDLSRTSLAYAKRKADGLGLDDIEFGQADILALPGWGRQFDFIACSGVLHHMADPAAGLKALAACARPGAALFLSLYSERARADVVAARAFIEAEGIADDLAGLREFRARLRALPEGHALKSIERTRDFYSASGLHDYVFNAHELRFTPLMVGDLLAECGLQFAGFACERGTHYAAFDAMFPHDPLRLDLANWDALEAGQPDLFTNMMHFWCVKP